jgi:hypothetical protein
MTSLGLALQGAVLGISIVALVLIFWLSLPLLTEWPAQWLGLSDALDRQMVLRCVEGTSTGEGKVRFYGKAWLFSEHRSTEELGGDTGNVAGAPRLRLAQSSGSVSKGQRHL